MKNKLENKDPHLRVEVLNKTDRPNLTCYLAMHQDYSEHPTHDDMAKLSRLSEAKLGERLIRRCIKYNHFGVVEYPSITFNVIGFPHSVISQARTHRVGCTFDVTSMRYTGKRFVEFIEKQPQIKNQSELLDEVNKLFYFRPVGQYVDREGKHYDWAEVDVKLQIDHCFRAMRYYTYLRKKGVVEEHARDVIPYNFRQNFVVGFNARSLMHFMDLRSTQDAQFEIRLLAQMMMEHFEQWMPELAEWYKSKRYAKNKLAP